MEVEHDDPRLEQAERDRRATVGRGDAVDRGFRKVMQVIRAAVDERDLYRMRSLRFEKLSGKRKGQRSLRINKQWRLIVEIRGQGDTKRMGVIAVDDYH